MEKKVYLSIVLHNHQPVGNFDFVFREAFEKSYLPLLVALENHPNIKAAMHFTGPLRDWLLVHEREYYLERLGKLVRRGQVEMLGGAYYEPILVMLEDRDKIGQLRMLSAAIEQDFGVRPRGMWLAERVWEPHLARPIAQAGLEYAVVDDTHFHFAGFRDEDLYGYYMTEEQSHPLRMIPAAQRMRNSMPWRPVDEFLAELRAVYDDAATPDQLLFAAADDGEKFGLWPGTYRRCWEEGWVDDLFSQLAANSAWIETITPGEYMDHFPAIGRAYLPTASYREMTEWSLPPEGAAELPRARERLQQQYNHASLEDPLLAEHLEAVQRYLRGGLWRNFLVKYPEVNHMQKRGVYISRRIHQLPESPQKQAALAHLWAAQCNCAYWHGLFGGIYLYHIRAANYQNLLEAENLILNNHVELDLLDFDLDSRQELVINSHPFSFVLDVPRGGAIIEWDDLPSRYNLLNIMSRRAEGYHAWLQEAAVNDNIITPQDADWERPQAHHTRARERGLEQYLIVDQHRRGMLIDHFLDDVVDVESFKHAQYTELGDFVGKPYELHTEQPDDQQATVTLWREALVKSGAHHVPLRVEKRFSVRQGERVLPVHYTLSNLSDQVVNLRFGLETAYGFDGGDGDLCAFTLIEEGHARQDGHLGRTIAYHGLSAYEVSTAIRGFKVHVDMDRAADVWRFPLTPVTMSEAGFERIHQGTIVLHVFQIHLAPGERWQLGLTLSISSLPGG